MTRSSERDRDRDYRDETVTVDPDYGQRPELPSREDLAPPPPPQDPIAPADNPIPLLLTGPLSTTDVRAVINWLIGQLNAQQAGLPVVPFAG